MAISWYDVGSAKFYPIRNMTVGLGKTEHAYECVESAVGGSKSKKRKKEMKQKVDGQPNFRLLSAKSVLLHMHVT